MKKSKIEVNLIRTIFSFQATEIWTRVKKNLRNHGTDHEFESDNWSNILVPHIKMDIRKKTLVTWNKSQICVTLIATIFQLLGNKN
jgi:hypothetical protein